MNYELAKQLYKDGTFKSLIPVTKANEKYLEFPPLEELLEACKGYFFSLSLNGSVEKTRVWWATRPFKNKEGEWTSVIGGGMTPELALARLYIKLNK